MEKLESFKLSIRDFIRSKRLQWFRYRLKNKDITIMCNNCNGTFIYNDLKLKFNSPTINLFISVDNFVKFMANLYYYLDQELKEFKDDSVNYPVGMLGDIRINFMHYESFENAKEKWIERCKRIDKSKIFVIMNETKDTTYEDLINFDKLPYEDKVVWTHKLYPEIKSSFYIKGFEEKGSCDFLFEFMPNKTIRHIRYYEQFNYVKFFNRSMK